MSRRRGHDHAGGQSPGSRAPSQRQLRVGEELRHSLAQLLRPGELRYGQHPWLHCRHQQQGRRVPRSVVEAVNKIISIAISLSSVP